MEFSWFKPVTKRFAGRTGMPLEKVEVKTLILDPLGPVGLSLSHLANEVCLRCVVIVELGRGRENSRDKSLSQST